MSHLFLDRGGGRLALYINGDLQFDASDERLYHEPLASLPLALARARFPASPLRVLILGGGDGLALREVLRFPQVREVRLVERDPEVLRLAREELSSLNGRALADPRVEVLQADARDVLPSCEGFHAVVWDLTYPKDLEGARLLTVDHFARARAALVPRGLLALNAVSPERTPEAFACLGASLEAAGLRALACSADIPSFSREGYGRWGFLFSSTSRVRERELADLEFPPGVLLTAGGARRALLFPAAIERLRAGANRSDELLYHIANPSPLAWDGPWVQPRFRDLAAPGPRLTAADGFARWLSTSPGQRTLERLLACVPLSRREQTRALLQEWSRHAEGIFKEVDLKAFAEAALARSAELPKAWVRELKRLRRELEAGLPDMRELLERAYRVFAVFLLVLLLANLVFPDNLYAKGFSTHYHGGSGSSWSGPSWSGFTFSRVSSGHRYYYRGSRVYDRQGNAYESRPLTFTDPKNGPKSVAALLALSPELQLLESGELLYKAGLYGFQCLLRPGRLRVLDGAGSEVLALLPTDALVADTQKLVLAQKPALDKTISDHGQWLEWNRWASWLPDQVSDTLMADLERTRKAAETVERDWLALPPRPSARPTGPGAREVLPGAWLEPPSPEHPAAPYLWLVSPDGAARRRGVLPPLDLTAEDRFVFSLLSREYSKSKDPILREIVNGWAQAHGPALGVIIPPVISPGSPGGPL